MKAFFLRSCVAALSLLAVGHSATAADTFPSKPVRIVVAAAPGGALDLTTRLVAQKMGEKLGQGVVVENRPGADELIAIRWMKTQPADGYTVLAAASTFSMLPFVKADPGFEPQEFTGVGSMTRSPLVLSVGAGSPDRTLQDLIARAKKEKLTFGSPGPAAPPSIGCLMFMNATGIQVTIVRYKGNGPALLDVMSDRVSMICDGYISSAPYLEAGKLRPLAVTSLNRLAFLPQVPTFKEQGVDASYQFWLGLLVRKGTPPEAVARLSEALKYALGSKELRERFRSEGSDATFVTPEAFTTFLAKENGELAELAAKLKLAKE
jgi:tripartite-type tricarboxylate transporter receptor subunit TctC